MPPKFRPKQKKRKPKSKTGGDKAASGAGGDAAAAARHKQLGNTAFSTGKYDEAVSVVCSRGRLPGVVGG